MARAARQKPARLSGKLLEIRIKLDLSQNGMLRHMGLEAELTREEVSAFERGIRVPPIPVLLSYARAAGVCLDVLADDEAELPKRLPAKPRHK
jgi:transcriptional regulator with XRE-family HTH domain